MRVQEVINEEITNNVVDFPIANVRRSNGAIGTQGVTTSQVADVLTHLARLRVSSDMSMRELVDKLKADPQAQERLRQSLKQTPVKILPLPDGSYHLEDGHHRIFLLNLLGDKTVPAIVQGDAPKTIPNLPWSSNQSSGNFTNRMTSNQSSGNFTNRMTSGGGMGSQRLDHNLNPMKLPNT